MKEINHRRIEELLKVHSSSLKDKLEDILRSAWLSWLRTKTNIARACQRLLKKRGSSTREITARKIRSRRSKHRLSLRMPSNGDDSSSQEEEDEDEGAEPSTNTSSIHSPGTGENHPRIHQIAQQSTVKALPEIAVRDSSPSTRRSPKHRRIVRVDESHFDEVQELPPPGKERTKDVGKPEVTTPGKLRSVTILADGSIKFDFCDACCRVNVEGIETAAAFIYR